MIIIRIYLFFIILNSIVFSAGNLPDVDTLNDRQARLIIADAEQKEDLILHVNDIHVATVDIPSLDIVAPLLAPGRPSPQSYFNTSDMKVVCYYIHRAIFHAIQDPLPVHTIVQKKAANQIVIKCDLLLSGDLSLHFQQIGGIGWNAIPDAAHLVGGLTNSIQVVATRKNGIWGFRTAYPIDYN